MPRILFLTQVLPYPLDAGPKVRAYMMLRHLAQKHEVTLVSFVRPDDKPEYVEHLRQFACAMHTVPMRRSWARNLRAAAKGLLTGLPIVIARDESAEMAELLTRLTNETVFDAIHADQLSMAAWGQIAAQFSTRHRRLSSETTSHGPPYTLLDEHNAIYRLTERMADEAHGLRRMIARREARVFRRYEADMLAAYDAVLAVTEEDRHLLLALFPEPTRAHQAAKLAVIPICVDFAQVHPVDHPVIDPSAGHPVILHLGTMFWPPNVTGVLWFAREVLPLIWERVPEARFAIVGKNPPAEVQALVADPRIEVTGYVADPLPYVQAADAFVVPLAAGGGMRVKILDAWLWGLPIVSTPIGAEGIDLHAGENILIAGDAPGFAAATVRLLTDPDLNRRLRTAGRAWVEATYDWRTVYTRVDAVYEWLLAEAGEGDHKGAKCGPIDP